MNRIITLLSFGALVCAASGDTLTWVGSDGGKWSDSANWRNSQSQAAVPANGDRLVIPSQSSPMAIENDIGGLTLTRIAFTGSGAAVTLKGKAYTLDNPSYAGDAVANLTEWPFVAQCALVTNEPAVTVKNSRTSASNRDFGIYAYKKLTFLSDVTGNDLAGRLYVDAGSGSSSYIDLLGRLTATNATLWGRSNLNLRFFSPINVKYIWYPDNPAWASWTLYFKATGNRFENWAVGPGGGMWAHADDPYPTNIVFRWNYEGTTGRNGTYYVQPTAGGGSNVTIDRIEASDPQYLYKKSGALDDTAYQVFCYSGTLTLRSSQDSLCYAKLGGWATIVWDPQRDFTLDLRDRTHNFKSGYGMTVRGGRLILSGKTVFNATYLTVASNAVVDVTATNGTVMASLSTLNMGEGARLYVTNAATQAFAAGKVGLTIGAGAYVTVGGGVTALSFGTVKVDGVPVAAGSYTGSDSSAADATRVPWLRGPGVVTVANSSFPSAENNYWKAAVSGNWSDATKWSLGTVPTSEQNVRLEVPACVDYTVTVDGAVSCPRDLHVAGCPLTGNRATLLVRDSFTATRSVYLKDGGLIDVPQDGALRVDTWYDPSLVIAGGGELRVSGGVCVLTNECLRYAAIAGTSAKTATVSVTDGTLTMNTRGFKLNLGDYAHLAVSGGLLVLDDNGGRYNVTDLISTKPASRVSFTGASRFRLTRAIDGLTFGSGTSEFADGTYYWNRNIVPGGSKGTIASAIISGVCAGEGETGILTFRDHAAIESCGDTKLYVGNASTNYAGSRSILRLLSDASHGSTTNGGERCESARICNYCRIGCGNGYGELDIADGAVPFGSYGVRIGSVENFGGTANPTATFGCTGVVQITGGRFQCTGASWSQEALVPPALLLGWGWPTLADAGRPYNGFVRMSGGSVSNLCHFVLGMNRGYGEWRQSGGETVQRGMNNGLMVGVAGGVGRLELSGGTFTAQYNVYVGGAPVSAFCNGELLESEGYPTDRHDAVGVLSVSGGSFVAEGWTTSTFYVGKDGDGTLEMDGSAGSFQANALELAAGAVEGGGQTSATLRFKLDAAGNVSPVKVKYDLLISDDSRLVVDASGCTTRLSGKIDLLNVGGNLTGTFKPANILFVGPAQVTAGMSVAWSGKTLKLKRGSSGLMILYR